VLLGALGTAATLSGVAACAGDDTSPTAPTDGPPTQPGHPAAVTEGAFESAYRNTEVRWGVAVPQRVDAEGLPVLLFLHGLGGDHRVPFDYLHLDLDLQAWADQGGSPFAVATIDGGTDWWKPLPGGTDAGRMLVDEYLPLLRDQGFDVDTLALGGASMGGYGALRLAGSDQVPVRCVSAIAPALGRPIDRSGPLTDVSEHPELLRGIPVQLAVGEADDFLSDDVAYADALRRAGVSTTSSTYPGGHSRDAMEVFCPHVIAFAGQHLT
jgi:predicted esterase